MILAGFHLTEKLDGLRIEIRAGRPYSKQGHPLRLPPWLAFGLSAFTWEVHAELYAGPGYRARLAGLTQSLAPDPSAWPSATGLYIFDWRRTLPDRLPSGFFLVPSFGPAESTVSALRLASAIISAGGEGLMARCPNLPWQAGRTMGLIKIKAAALIL